jgi:hypothetical protein
MKTSTRRSVVAQAAIVVLLAAVASFSGCSYMKREPPPVLDTPYQAVLLDTGQVYFGKLEGAGTDYPVLRDVFYVQSAANPETKQVTNILVRRGKEWHAPDRMILNARHIVLIEPVGPESKVAQLISEAKKQ